MCPSLTNASACLTTDSLLHVCQSLAGPPAIASSYRASVISLAMPYAVCGPPNKDASTSFVMLGLKPCNANVLGIQNLAHDLLLA